MKPKRCKQCKELFTPTRPLESVCGFQCAIERSYDLNKKKRDKDNWSFRKIAEELNKLNHKTITGKEYTTANTYRLYKDITNKKKIRTYFN